MKWKAVVLPILILIYASSALSNRHEHFTSWPTATNLISAYNETFRNEGKKFHDMNVDEIFLTQKLNTPLPLDATDQQREQRQRSKNVARASSLKSVMSDDEFNKLTRRYAVDPNQKHHLVMEALGEKLKGQNIKQIATHFNKQPGEDSAKRILKFLDETPKSSQAYMKIETIRRNLFSQLKENSPEKYNKFLENSFNKTIRDIPIENRKFIGFSIPHELYSEELAVLKKSFKNAGTKAHFYLSIPRGQLSVADNIEKGSVFASELKSFERSMNLGWGDGIDITGSIKEGDKPLKPIEQERMRERMKDIVKVLSTKEKDTVLRLHAFEATNKGGFYDEIYGLLDNVTSKKSPKSGKPPVISIGHINELTESDMKKMAKLRDQAGLNNVPFKMVFDVNYQSNVQLQNAEGTKLAATINRLRDYRFPVAFGSDGTGILGQTSSDVNQARLIAQHGVNEWTVNQMTDESRKAPVCEIPKMSGLVSSFSDGILK